MDRRSSIFTNEKLNQDFERNGFVVLKKLFRVPDDFGATIIAKHKPEIQIGGLTNTFFINDEIIRRKTSEEITNFLWPKLYSFFNDYVPVNSLLMIKNGNVQEEMPIHQDWSYVDESKFVSVNCWTPLVNTNSFNGGLGVIPKSHLFFLSNIRGPGIKHPFSEFNSEIRKYGEILKLNIGDVLIYNHKLLHFSAKNTTNRRRVSLSLIAAPKEAPLLHYKINSKGGVDVYKNLSKEFFYSYENCTSKRPMDEIDVNLIAENGISFFLNYKKSQERKFLSYKNNITSKMGGLLKKVQNHFK